MMNERNGRRINLIDHVQQSIRNILFTRIGTRVEREEYGSLLPELLDMPLNDITLLRCNAAVILAIARWEPRYQIEQAQTQVVPQNGSLAVQIQLSGSLNGNLQNYIIEA
ncbi:GPW/gp25 family protein [Kingella sp. (in: b-proteobacteria)]|uniref:GPW/gp25 family protein n=1 Tax=Kingella sp. (in: b-proteobacteria) TaxID=2020713 RepID=UPI0026DCE69B|nr:GPW/gp25 family protein [Kingella sp. (in: b-proteobacteria)]MDO4658342.1 GPW/gp25 family protein [Kingella sp. (in: b-proteobacteria)]